MKEINPSRSLQLVQPLAEITNTVSGTHEMQRSINRGGNEDLGGRFRYLHYVCEGVNFRL
jgi:hypothetical protein